MIHINQETSEKISELIYENETLNNFLRRLLGLAKDKFLRPDKFDGVLAISIKDDVIKALEERSPMLTCHKAIRDLIGLPNLGGAGALKQNRNFFFELPFEKMKALQPGEYASVAMTEKFENGTVGGLKHRFRHAVAVRVLTSLKNEVLRKEVECGRKFDVAYKRSRQRFDVYCVKILTEGEIEALTLKAPYAGIISLNIPEETIRSLKPKEHFAISPGVRLDEAQIGEALKQINDYLRVLGEKNNKRYRVLWMHKRSLFNIYCFDIPTLNKENGNGKYTDDLELL